MDHELWSQLSHAMFDVARTIPRRPHQTFDTHRIVRVYLWAVLHDRPVDWATRASSWDNATRPQKIPSQSAMSRRLRHSDTSAFLTKLAQRLSGRHAAGLVKSLDGKPLAIPRHTHDPDARSGRGVGGMAKGYKLHAIWGNKCMPLAWSVQPMNVAEVTEAKVLLPQLKGGGYVLADANYDRNHLYDLAAKFNHQLLAPRPMPFTSLGNRRHSSYRLRSLHLMEQAPSPFGRELHRCRKRIEREFGGLVAFGGGLQCLPSWVRTLPRVRLFVHAKLIINAARLRRLHA